MGRYGMTDEEVQYKEAIEDILNKEGRSVYCKYLEALNIDINLRTPSKGKRDFIAFMQPDAMRIVINPEKVASYKSGYYSPAQLLSMLVRHELMHFFLEHEMRLLRHVMDKYEAETGERMTDEEAKNLIYSNQIFNIAADLEINNRAYTEVDEEISRELGALVTKDYTKSLGIVDDWSKESVEYMYDELVKRAEEVKKPPIGKPKPGIFGKPPSGGGSSGGQPGGGEPGGEPEGEPGTEGGEGQGGGGGSDEDTTIYGEYVDEHTFIDSDGNVIKF